MVYDPATPQIIPIHLQIAIAEIGVQEIIGEGSNPRIDEYLKVVGMPSDDSIPWCAAFANWVLREAGMVYSTSAKAIDLKKVGDIVLEPRLGCILIFHRGSLPWQRHATFYIDEDREHFIGVGGNQKNRVCTRPYKKNTLDVMIMPKWEEVGETA